MIKKMIRIGLGISFTIMSVDQRTTNLFRQDFIETFGKFEIEAREVETKWRFLILFSFFSHIPTILLRSRFVQIDGRGAWRRSLCLGSIVYVPVHGFGVCREDHR